MAASLVRQGADRVIAMLAPVTDPYATALAGHLYHALAARPGLTAGQALAGARYLSEEERRAHEVGRRPPPEYGVPVLLAAGGDGALTDPAAPEEPLKTATAPPGGTLARDLPMGALIGRRAQMRTAMGVLRRTDRAVEQFGPPAG
jgi:D-aminopeptidase